MKQTAAPANTPNKTSSQPFFGRQGGASLETAEPTFFGPAPFIQAKLTIGAPDDPYEREADQVAEQVVQRMAVGPDLQAEPPKIQRMPLSVQRKCATCEAEEKVQKKDEEPEKMEGEIQRKPIFESGGDDENLAGLGPAGPVIQRKCAECEKEEIGAVQRKPNGSGEMTASPDVASRLSASRGGGSPLPESVQTSMGWALGADLSGVRVHTDSQAVQLSQDLGAQAFTHGSDVYFGAGKFQPGTGDGDQLLAHELVHVGQQGGGKQMLQNNSSTQPAVQNQRIQKTGDDEIDLNSLVLEAEAYRANFEALHTTLMSYSQASLQIGDLVRVQLSLQSDKYDGAYRRYSSIIAQGSAEARNQEFWTNIALGVAAGVAMGLLAAWALPAAGMSAAFEITMQEVVITVASNTGQAVGGALLSGGIGSALRPAGTDLQPAGINPLLLQVGLWRTTAEIYRSGLALNDQIIALHKLTVLAQGLKGEARVHVAGGESAVTPADLEELATHLNRANWALLPINPQIQAKLSTLQAIQAQVQSLTDYTEGEMERDIWILGIADLSDPAVLDLDAIEDYLHANLPGTSIKILGPNSVLGVDFGWYTSDEDEQEAQQSARRLAPAVRVRVRSLGSPTGQTP